MKAYITKGCLTHGIRVVEGESHGNLFILNEPITREIAGLKQEIKVLPAKDWWHTYADALARAEHCRLDGIRSSERQVRKLKSIVFKNPDEE